MSAATYVIDYLITVVRR